MPRASRRFVRTVAFGLLALGWDAGSRAASEPVPEKLVMSALVYNIAKLTEWPQDAFSGPEAPVTLCLLRDGNTYQGILEPIAGKPVVQGRPLEIRADSRLSQLAPCQLLYLDEADEPRLFAVLKALQGQPVLTVGNFDGFAEAGGMISLFVENEQMRLRINQEAALAGRLHISSQLLRMGQIVKGGTP